MTRPDRAPWRQLPAGMVASSDPAMADQLAAILAAYAARVAAGHHAAPSPDRWAISDRD
jgi:hypothetical protein